MNERPPDRHVPPTNALTFDVRDQGPLDGDPVVLLHGWPERAASWDAVAARLHEHGLRTLAPDQRGYSPGARPRFRTSYRLPALVADIEALIDRDRPAGPPRRPRLGRHGRVGTGRARDPTWSAA